MQVRNGDCTPFLGAGASSGRLPLGADLSRELAASYQYPFRDAGDLTQVTQYATVVDRESVVVKQQVVARLSHGDPPASEAPGQLHSLLARQSLDVYVTTNYDRLIAEALVDAGKDPVTVICPWWSLDARDTPATKLPRGYQPTVDRPLVYHLHGHIDEPASLVITEDDYLEFLVTLSRGPGLLLPPPVLSALTERALLFVGYGLRDWSFRTVFRALGGATSPVRQRRHVSVQLLPAEAGAPDEDNHAPIRNYLDMYYDRMNISAHWSTIEQFCTDLARRLDEP